MNNKKDNLNEDQHIHDHENEHNHDCDNEHNDEEMIIEIELENDEKLECEILGNFLVEDREYMVLLPKEEEEVLLFKYEEDEENEEFELNPIEDEEEFEMAVKAYYELFSEEENEEDI